MKIAVDAMGGDFAPKVVVEGAVAAALEWGIPVILVGREEVITEELKKCKAGNLPIEVCHASEVIAMEESPSVALRKKKDSSIKVCFDLVKKDKASAMVSAGNSGAVMAHAVFILGRVEGIERPAIAAVIPNLRKATILLDVGANVECKPLHLAQFALMGSVYAKYLFHVDKPKIGLLCNGEEESKGNELVRETHEVLKTSSLDYIGYVEGGDIFNGKVEVVVCDGFVGNVVIKSLEGLVYTVVGILKNGIEKSFFAKMGYAFGKKAFVDMRKKMDYSEFGGAPLLGVNGGVIITHGSANAKAIKNAVRMGYEYSANNVTQKISEEILKNSDVLKLMKNKG